MDMQAKESSVLGARRRAVAANIEPFDSFWEAPEDLEKGYKSFYLFYKDNYSHLFPQHKDANILCISCGPGYGVNLLNSLGYANVLGIDSFPQKVEYAHRRKLNCQEAYAFEFLEDSQDACYDLIFVEQELNHLTKPEILAFLGLCRQKLKPGGRLISFSLNGANPITGAEALAQNFDHQNTFTEYTFRQVLLHSGFSEIKIFDLNLYVFYSNPFNYAAMAAAALLKFFFRVCYILYGKNNKLFAKKIAGTCVRPA